jgi:hypothetical protein
MEWKLHEHQQAIYDSDAKYKVVAAGRRFGKSFLAALILFNEGSKSTKILRNGEVHDLSLEEVYYVAPTFEQGKRIMWPLLKDLGNQYGIIQQTYENTCELRLINGRRISIKGADRPDSLRGVGLSYVVLDEYAFMKEEVWEVIIEPALARPQGGALFIGTPDGKNHFYDMWNIGKLGLDAEFESWHYTSLQNPFLDPEWVAKRRARLSDARFRQEYEASFEAGGGLIFTREMFPIIDELPSGGDTYICMDPAGFTKVEGGRKLAKRSEHAIAVVDVYNGNYWVIRDIIHGQWEVRETALRMIKAWHDYRPFKFGVEQGMAKAAIQDYLESEQERHGIYFNVEELKHGNQRKEDRIEWALQGRADKGRISLLSDRDRGEGEKWNKMFVQQACDFPSLLAPNDLIDAVAYIDQVAETPFDDRMVINDEWTPMDEQAGY